MTSEKWYPGKLVGLRSFKERPLLDVLASSPEEIRGFRRQVVSGVITAVFLGAFLTRIVERSPTSEALAQPYQKPALDTGQKL